MTDTNKIEDNVTNCPLKKEETFESAITKMQKFHKEDSFCVCPYEKYLNTLKRLYNQSIAQKDKEINNIKKAKEYAIECCAKIIKELQAEIQRLSDLCFDKESKLMDLQHLIPIKNKIKRK